MGDVRYAIGLVVHPTRPVRESVEVIMGFARQHGGSVLVREVDAARVGPGVEVVTAEAFAARVDGVVSLGGDGTMLGAMRLLVGRRTPILGVNHGNLGFLVEVPPAGLAAALDRMVAGDYALEPHSGLDVCAAGRSFTAFNDVVVTAAEQLRAAVVAFLGVVDELVADPAVTFAGPALTNVLKHARASRAGDLEAERRARHLVRRVPDPGPLRGAQFGFQLGVEEVAEHEGGEVDDAEQRQPAGEVAEDDPAMADQVHHPHDAGHEEYPAPVQQRRAERDPAGVAAVRAIGVGSGPQRRVGDQTGHVHQRRGDEAESGGQASEPDRIGECGHGTFPCVRPRPRRGIERTVGRHGTTGRPPRHRPPSAPALSPRAWLGVKRGISAVTRHSGRARASPGSTGVPGLDRCGRLGLPSRVVPPGEDKSALLRLAIEPLSWSFASSALLTRLQLRRRLVPW
ncbi:NAD(+)/NADH kinase [Phytohabitans kaempferiae]|uniref:NAD(+)/NADH kinase n=1 Tax=Phytohabitans kaempferiae TaxID=1620943 RepID=A0ABV6M1C4_9ACTN